MDKSFDLGKLLQNHVKKHKSKPSQFVSVALGVKNRLDKCNKKRRSSRLTIFDKIRNIPRSETPIPPKAVQKSKLEHRMKQLEKWKEEKQKKKMEAAAQKKKPFVAGVPHNPLKFVPPPPPKPMPSTSGRVTRSQTSRNEEAKVPKNNLKSTYSFAPKNAKFNPVLNRIVKLPLELPKNVTKNGSSKLTSGIKSDNKTKSSATKPDTSKVKTKINVNVDNNKVVTKILVSKSASNVDSISMAPLQKHRSTKNINVNVKQNKVNNNNLVSESSSIIDSAISAVQNHRSTRKNSLNVKKNTVDNKILVSESSSSVDLTLPPRDQKHKPLRKSISSNKVSTPKNSVPKSESSSEEKLKSPKLPKDVPMTPEQIVEAVQKFASPCVTMSRGKDNAMKEMKKKIEEGLLDEDVCEMDSLDHFKEQLDSEIKRMTEMCSMWDKILEQVPLPEPVQEAVLSAVGQARLLMSQKLQQFASLLARAERPEPGTALVTPTDLHGFWDMVFMQVENIDMRFKKLEEMRARNWVDEPPPARAIARPAARPAPRSNRPQAPRATASRLKDLIAAKRKEKKDQDQGQHEIVAPEMKIFDAGFFSVKSPVRSHPSSATLRRSLLHAVLSSEAQRASASKNNASFAMLRASSISKNVDNDDSLFTSNPVLLTPVNLCATPARSILKSANSQSTRKSGKKSIKMVLFNNSDTEVQNISINEKPGSDKPNIIKESESNNIVQKHEDRLSTEVEKETADFKRKSKLIRQDAVEDRSPVMTRSRRKSIQTPLLEEKTEKTPRRTRRKHALQEIDVNVIDEKVTTPKKSSRRKSLITPVH